MKKIYFFGSILLFFLIAVTAVYGLFVPGAYSRETANWATQARAQDWVDLLLAAPILLVSAFLAYKKSSKAYLVWLGTLFLSSILFFFTRSWFISTRCSPFIWRSLAFRFIS
ncbi:MAG: hypothetical protein WCB96_12665 [Candidatus Aminicenantales bacterium]